jgi:hypothetical protein
MNLEIAVVAVGLARQQAFELAPRRRGAQPFECRLGLGDDDDLAFRLTERDQLDRLAELALDLPATVDRLLQPGPLPQQLLCRRRIVP